MQAPIGKVRRLVGHFLSGITDNDLIAPGEDLHATIAGALAVFLVVSAGVALMLIGRYNSVALMVSGQFGPARIQTLADKLKLAVDDESLLLGLAMIAMALLTTVFWDSLGLDDRDRAVLGPLPVRPASVLAAKAAAVASAAAVVAVALNLLPAVFLPLVVLLKVPVAAGMLVRWMVAHAAAGLAGCALVFLALSALRGLAGALLPRRMAYGLLPLAQFALVLSLLCLLLSWPVVAGKAGAAVATESAWLFLLPPMWVLGLEEVLAGRTTPLFAALTRVGLVALAVSVTGACTAHVFNLRLRTHAAATSPGSPVSLIGRVVSAFVERIAVLVAEDGRARASFLFTARTLTRSPHHRLYLAVALGLGAAVSCATLAVATGGLGFGRQTLDVTSTVLSAQLNLIFFLVIGIRMSIGVPADLDAGWIFRFHVTPARARYLAGARGAIFFLFVLPILACLAPLHAFLWGWYAALVHFAFGVVAALILLEVVFANYEKLPFVSAFTPGRVLISLWLPLYVIGYIAFVWLTPYSEWVLVERAGMAYTWLALFVVVVARLLASQSSRVRNDTMPVFDEDAGDVQVLGLGETPGGKRLAVRDEPASPTTSRTLGSLGSGRLFGAISRQSTSATICRTVAAWRDHGFRGAARASVNIADQLCQDVLFATRRLRANPGFTAFSILTLALGIGATTAIHSVIYSTVLRPLEVPHRDDLVNIYHTDPFRGGSRAFMLLSRPDFDDFRAMQTVFSDVAAHTVFRQIAVVSGAGERLVGECVSGNFFSVLDLRAALGRNLQPADDQPSSPPVAVISDQLWRRRFDARPDVIGRTIKMGGHDFEIVGVAPSGFHGVELQNLAPASVWVPLSTARLVGFGDDPNDREARWLGVKGRLAPGRTVAQATAETAVVARRLDEATPIGLALPSSFRGPGTTWRPWTVVPTRDILVAPRVDWSLRLIARLTMAAVGLVLLVACSNLANLMLARGAARRREHAIRLALGASRWKVVREQLVESALVAATGAAAALGVLRAAMAYGQHAVLRYGPWVSVELAPQFDAGVAAAALGATVLALVVFGLAPAVQLTRLDVRAALGGTTTGEGGRSWRGRRLLIASQVAVSVALVAVASLGLRQMIETARLDTGLDLDRLALVRFDFAVQGWNEDRERRSLDRLVEEARRLPGIQALALSSGLPIGSGSWLSTRLAAPDRPFGAQGNGGQPAALIVATPGVFTTLRVRLISGRSFDERDTAATTPVVVLSEVTAKRLFDSEDVVGRQVLRRRPTADQAREVVETVTIVGVAADTGTGLAAGRDEGVAYVPFAQQFTPSMAIVARTSQTPAAAVTALKTLTSRLEPQLGIVDSGSGAVLAGVESLAVEILVSFAGVLGAVALTLAMVGLYGVLSFVVSGRTYEMGVRLALGARASQIMRLVIADGIRPVILGLVAGFAIGDLAQMVLRPVFVNRLPAIDPLVLGLVPVPFLIAACVACYLPARRAAKVDPNVALRQS